MSPSFNNAGKMTLLHLREDGPRVEIGYQLSQTSEAEQKALYCAFDLVRQIRHLGMETRTWANKANVRTKALLVRLKATRKADKASRGTIEKKMRDLSCWENQILAVLRAYMNETSMLMNRLKPLNPPLTSEHLKPFMEAMLADRRTTVDAMEPLTKTVSELTAYKLRLSHQNPDQIFDYKPSY